jgi:hypothetical protein
MRLYSDVLWLSATCPTPPMYFGCSAFSWRLSYLPEQGHGVFGERTTILQFLSKGWPADGLTNKPARADDFCTYVQKHQDSVQL